MSQLRHVANGVLPYLLSVPNGVAPPGGWPVICFLHGYDEAADSSPIRKALTKHGPFKSTNPARILNEFIVLAPQMPGAGDRWHTFSDAVQNIVKTVQQDEHGDSSRTYLTGFSFGGNGVFDLAMVQPNFWAALWPVDPTRVPSRDLGLPVWVSIGSAARRNTEGYIATLKLQPVGDFMSQNRIYLDEKIDHVGSATKAYQDERIYNWILSKRHGLL